MSQNNPSIPTAESPVGAIFYVGVDVAKATLQADWGGGTGCFENNLQGIRRLLQAVRAQGAEPMLILEATGGYEARLAAAAHEAQIALCVLDPGRVRAFARALGQRAKTDPIDAALLRTFGERVRPRPTLRPSPAQAELAALQSRRRQLVRLIVAEKNHAEHALGAAARKSVQRSLAHLEKELTRIEAAFERAAQEEPTLVARLERLEQIPGVGRKTACAVVASAPELGTLNRRQAGALPGLAPHPRQSGPRDGQRSISGGRPHLRVALYMATLTAVRHYPPLQAFYQRLLTAGKKPKVALTAAMRKLFLLMNLLLKHPELELAR
jgi:transposase